MSTLKETLYLRCPFPVQRIIVSLWGWWWYHRRYSSHHLRFVDQLRAAERWTAEEFRAYQEVELDKLLTCARKSLYYKDLFRRYDVDQNLNPFEALSRIPILTREIIRAAPRKLLTSSPPFRTITLKTSGTTGTPIEIYSTAEFHAWWMALTKARCHQWAGVYRNRRIMFGARKICSFAKDSPPFWHFSPTENLAYASIYHLSNKFLPRYIEFLRNFKPDLVEGFPSALVAVARYAIENNLLPAPAKAICTVSESFSDIDRKLMEKAWQCKVFDRYTSVEGCLFVSQCEFGRYHVSPEAGIIEIVDSDGRPVKSGVPGHVVCTGLRNLLQPLIRYKIGDVARWSNRQDCLCGRKMPILEAIEGRFEDLCFTPDGRQMLRFDTAFKGVACIKEAQVVQDSLEQFTVYVVPAAGFTQEILSVIQRNMYSQVGKLQIDVKCVDTIPRSPSGKFQAVVCKLSQAEKDRVVAAGSNGLCE